MTRQPDDRPSQSLLDIHQHLRDRQALVNDALARRFAGVPRSPLVDAMRDALLCDGKRLRAILCLDACEWVGGRLAHVLPAACAIEMIHKMTLTHDDLPAMDDADTRNGRMTVHRAHGEALAILAGDGLLVEAFGLLASIREVEAERVLRATRRLCQALGASGVAGGQAEDVMMAPAMAGDDAWLHELHARKTGSLFEAAVAVGAELGGGSDAQIAALARYGRNLGIAFQISDDLLDARAARDEREEKTNYACVFGPDEARRKVHALLQESVAALRAVSDQAGSQAGDPVDNQGGNPADDDGAWRLVGITEVVLQRCRGALGPDTPQPPQPPHPPHPPHP